MANFCLIFFTPSIEMTQSKYHTNITLNSPSNDLLRAR